MVNNKEITPFQLLFILIHSQIGIGVISLPYKVYEKANGDGWISILLAGVIIQIAIFFTGFLMKRFPNHNLFEIIQLLFGKWFGKAMIILYCGYFLFLGGVSLAKFAFILKTWMMPLTPKWLLVTLIVLVAIYVVKEQLHIAARFFLISSFIIVIFIGLAAYTLKNANFTYIIPIANEGFIPIVKGVAPSLYSYQGFEMILLIYPLVQPKQKGLVKTATLANVFVTLFYTFIVITSLLFFSPAELKLIPEPLLYIAKSVSFKIIERPDLFITSMWIVLVATSVMAILYASSLGLSVALNSRKRSNYVFIAAGICFILAMNIKGNSEVAAVTKFINPFIFPLAIVFPILFLLVATVFNKKGGESR